MSNNKLHSKQGIYRLTINSRVYYGRSVDLGARRSKHYSLLINGKHHNPILQNSFKKHPDFQFRVMEFCKKEYLEGREQFYIDSYDNCNMVDSSRGGCGIKGEKHHFFDHNKYLFYNHSKGLILKCTQYELVNKYQIEQKNLSAVLSRRKPSIGGWTLVDNGILTPPRTEREFYFKRSDGLVFIGVASDFYKKFNLDPSSVFKLINGKRDSVKKWRFIND